jgi:hypothetical protein
MDQDYFGAILVTVVGQAFTAAGYALEDLPVKQAGGQYRFSRRLDDGSQATIEFQSLMYTDSEWSSGQPSRFRVTLLRSDGLRRDLSALVVRDFGVSILPSAAHWWTFRTVDDLGKALAEAGHLAVGYGMPWLAGELTPPPTSE